MTDTTPATHREKTLTEQRKQLLRKRLAERGLTAATAPAEASVAGPRPLAPAPARMWFLQQLEPESAALNICTAFQLRGALSAARLRAAFATVAARHEVLRTAYHAGPDGQPAQTVRAEVTLDWQEHDLSGLTGPAQRRRLEVLARREFGRPFELDKGQPWRMVLARTGATEHVLVLVAHHICWDDESWPVFAADLSAAYNTEAALASLPPAPAPVPAAPAASEYWRETLLPLPDPVELPGERGQAPASAQAGRCVTGVPAALLRQAGAVARAHSATPFMVLLAGYCAVVAGASGARDLLIAVPVSDRHGAHTGRIGYFGNTVLVRVRVAAGASFAQLLAEVVAACTGAFAHQQTGIDEVVRMVNPDRSGGDGFTQLARLSFAARSAVNGFALDGIAVTPDYLGSPVSTEPLSVMVVWAGDTAAIEATYQAGVLEQPVVAQLLASYLRLLTAALEDPDRRLDSIDLLGGTVRAGLLAASHGELVPFTPTTLNGMFEARAAAGPDRIALSHDHGELRYRELNERANRLAHWLIRHGHGPEQVIGLRLDTSAGFIVAVLAVLKAGAAYLPIDPNYPPARIDYLIQDAKPALVLDHPGLAAAEADAQALPVTDPVDSDRLLPLRPQNLAYVMYTSGSTGAPKGVPVSHAAITEHLAGFCDEFGMSADDVLLQSASVSFDASLLDIFVTLLLGARLVVPKPDALRDIVYLADTITRQGVTVLHFVPSVLSTLLLLPAAAQWRNLRHVPVGGEALAGELADKFAEMFDAQLRNHYGPTEAVVCATAHRVDGPQGTRVVPIGRPNRNVGCYLLDSALRLVPTGVTGEIYLGGAQLARGYAGRAGLTASRFVADPFSPGGRLYRTGDLGRWNTQGDIEFAGRADEQVKIRGVRIELGEVEAAITSFPGVAHCVVIGTTDDVLGPMLAAYLVAPEPADFTQLRRHLANTLPEYMIPAGYAMIDAIPMTAHGKLDRAALPVPQLVSASTYRAPATPTQEQVAGLFGQLFGRDRIGADDSFFELGGHSLLAARLITMIQAEFGVDLDIRAAFDTPTVAGLAGRIVDRLRDELGIDLDEPGIDFDELEDPANGTAPAPPAAPSFLAAPRPERIPLSHSQLAMWFQYRLEGPGAALNIPLTVRITGTLDTAALGAAFSDVLARHDSLRCGFAETDGSAYQFVRPPAPVTMPVIQVREAALADELAVVAGHRFALETDALVQARLYALEPQVHVLSLLVHHIVADHTALGLIVSELAAAYQDRAAGRAARWPGPAPQYPEYALWQREFLDSPAGAEQLDYWRTRLAGLPAEIAVAHDRPRPAVSSRASEIASLTIPAARRAQLQSVAAAASATEFMLCQSAVAVTLYLLGGGVDIPLGSPVSGRTQPGLGELAGLLANMVILRNDLSGNPTLREVLSRSRDTVLGAAGHQDIPIERLVEALNPPRSRSRNPLFQAMVHFREPQPPVSFGAAQAAILPVDFEVSLLDINADFAVTAAGDVTARIVASKDLYEPATVALIAETLDAVLAAFASEPDAAIGALDPMTAARRHTVLQWSTGGTSPDNSPGFAVGTLSRSAAGGGAGLTLVAAAGVTASDVNPGPGADVVTVPGPAWSNPDELARLIAAHQPQHVVAGPAVLASLALSGVSELPSVRMWSVAQPTGPAALPARLQALAPGSRVEFRYHKDEYTGPAALSGRPAPGVRIFVLDTALRLLPPGSDGEIYLGGSALAQGYPGETACTASYFIADPFTPGQRLFRTGDRARWNGAGELIFRQEPASPVSAADAGTSEVTGTARTLITILEELLEISGVNPDDNFFALGGDSVISIQWAARANSAGLPLAAPMVFEHMTIAALAAAVERAGAEAAAEPAPAQQHEPMSLSGLDADTLSALTSSWAARS